MKLSANTKVGLFFVSLIGFIAACGKRGGIPTEPNLDFWSDDPELAASMKRAAERWAKAGVYIARAVTVNVHRNSMPIAYAPLEDMAMICSEGRNPIQPAACTTYTPDSTFDAIWVADNVKADRLDPFMMHELMHCLIPDIGHLPDGQVGVMHTYGASDTTVTADDLDLICRKTGCDGVKLRRRPAAAV